MLACTVLPGGHSPITFLHTPFGSTFPCSSSRTRVPVAYGVGSAASASADLPKTLEVDSKWRNTRQTNKLIRINRTTDVIGEKLLRTLHENMKNKNVTRVIIITTAEFSPQAVDFANTRPIELHGKSDLIDILKKI